MNLTLGAFCFRSSKFRLIKEHLVEFNQVKDLSPDQPGSLFKANLLRCGGFMSCNESTASLWVMFLVLVVPSQLGCRKVLNKHNLGPKKTLKLEQVL